MGKSLADLIELNEKNGFHFFKQRNLEVFQTEVVSGIFNDNYFLVKEPLYEVDANNAIVKKTDEKYFFVNEVDWSTGFVCRAVLEKFTAIEDARSSVYLLGSKNTEKTELVEDKVIGDTGFSLN